jgi:outer membrane protein TolC
MAILLSGLLMVWGAGAALADTGTGTAAGSGAGASGPGAQQITLQQALSMAEANSTSLVSSSFSINQAGNTVTQQAEPITGLGNLTYTPSGSTSPATERAFNALVAANLSWELAQKDYQAAQDTVNYAVYQDYFAIVQGEATLDAEQQAFNLVDLNQRITNLKYQIGSDSQDDVSQENQLYAQAQASLTADQNDLDTTYQQFNQLVGLAPDDRPVLTDQPSFTPLVIDSLDAEVSRVLATDPAITSSQNSVTEQKEALNVVSDDPAANAANADTLGEAQQSLASTQNSVSQGERNTYYSIQKLESDQVSLQQALTTAETNLQMTQVEYDVGMDTKVDLKSEQSLLSQAQLALLENTISHQLAVMAFETPWAVSGGSSGSGGSSSGSGGSGQ